MSDIKPPTNVENVKWQEEKPTQEGGHRAQAPPEKVAETYEEHNRSVTDKISILGIPIDLMTTQVQSTIAGLVSEVDYLKARVKRYEKQLLRTDAKPVDDVLLGDHFISTLDRALSLPLPTDHNREVVLVVVNTYEDIRASSGLLSANSVLADVASRIASAGLGADPVGLVGGPMIAALLTKPELSPIREAKDQKIPISTADIIRGVLEETGYTVAGLDMSLRFTIVSLRVEAGQSALHAIGQCDHVLRS